MRRRAMMEESSSYMDVLFCNKQTQEKKITNKLNEVNYSLWEPIGVVVIPAEHDVYGTGECGVMALRYGSLTTPDEGQNSYLEAYFGNNTLTVSPTFYNKLCVVDCDRSELIDGVYKVNNIVIETTSISYLPSDKFKKRNQSEQYYEAIDGFLYYNYVSSTQGPFIPSPYLKDGSRNLSYSQTEAPSSTLNALSDFNGKSHTELLCSQATAQENWQTAAQITNSSGSGYQTAACICWRYHTLGTNQGDWYIPACGELGYVLVLLEKIEKTIEYLKKLSNISFYSCTGSYHWSSTHVSQSVCYSIRFSDGIVIPRSKDSKHNIRPFYRGIFQRF